MVKEKINKERGSNSNCHADTDGSGCRRGSAHKEREAQKLWFDGEK